MTKDNLGAKVIVHVFPVILAPVLEFCTLLICKVIALEALFPSHKVTSFIMSFAFDFCDFAI